MQDFEKLGMFYLGRRYDLAAAKTEPEPVLYDSKDLTTHAVCVGMTGSGKTGLCLALLEEAAIDGVPAIAIDPKGDLGNLLLTFPQLEKEDFLPWIDESDAARKGISPDELAAKTADTWRRGLADWGETPERIGKFRDAVDLAIYTPGSSAGLPLTVLRSFAAPPEAVRSDAEAMRERIGAAVSGLLALLGVDADPIRSREHILLSQLLDDAWRQGRDVDLGGLVHAIQRPPFERVGVVDIETFFPAAQRVELSMRLNNLLASPGFAGWLEGEPLDVGRLLHTGEDKPRLSIISIAHLSDAERMFFVTILLGEVLSWMRSQPGTSSLRAILYMDEIFGFFPPTANPPSKTPMLTLLKQARAYGLGVVLATQNPVDLDYKGLSNTGTWFLGRLQTERDKARVLEGLEGASAAAGAAFDRAKMEAQLAALANRVFLMNNVHENAPVVFQTRWCLSYLRGPLTRAQIQTLMAPYKAARGTAGGAAQQTAPAGAPAQPIATASSGTMRSAATRDRPLVPPEAGECFMPRRGAESADKPVVYRPTLFGSARLHYVDAKAGIDSWQDVLRIVPLEDRADEQVWDKATELGTDFANFDAQPVAGAQFEPAPGEALRGKSYARWQKEFATHLYTHERLKLWNAPGLKEYSKSGESEEDFRVRANQLAQKQYDAEIELLKKKFEAKREALRRRSKAATRRLEEKRSKLWEYLLRTVSSIAYMVAVILKSRKWTSQRNVSSARSAAGNIGRSARDRSEMSQVQDEQDEIRREDEELDVKFNAEKAKIPLKNEIEAYDISPRKSDIAIQRVSLVWNPNDNR